MHNMMSTRHKECGAVFVKLLAGLLTFGVNAAALRLHVKGAAGTACVK